MVMRQDRAGRHYWCLMMALVMVGLGTAACGADEDSTGATGGITPVASVAPAQSPILTPSAEAPKFVKVTATPAPGTKQDALFLEAKKVYETYLEQTLLFEQEGGGETLPPDLEKVVDRDWREAIEEYYAKVKKRGHFVRHESAGYGLVSIAHHEGSEGHVIAIDSCVDQRSWEFIDSGGNVVSRGTLKRNQMFFDRISGRMVIVDGLSERVDKCKA